MLRLFVMLVAPIDKLEAADPVKVPFAAVAGKVRVPFKIKVWPPKFKTPFVKELVVATVTFPPSVMLPSAARFKIKVCNVNGEAVGIIVPNAPVPPIVKLEFTPPVIVPAPVIVPFKLNV